MIEPPPYRSKLGVDRHMAKRQKTGGRRKGTPNKVTAEIRDAAHQYTVEALEGLAQIARTSDSDAATAGRRSASTPRWTPRSPL